MYAFALSGEANAELSNRSTISSDAVKAAEREKVEASTGPGVDAEGAPPRSPGSAIAIEDEIAGRTVGGVSVSMSSSRPNTPSGSLNRDQKLRAAVSWTKRLTIWDVNSDAVRYAGLLYSIARA